MIAVDTNVLIYAHREEVPQHTSAKKYVERLALGIAPWSIPILCLSEFVRVVTHPRVFSPPSPLTTALAFIDAVLESPSVTLLVPDADYWAIFRKVSLQANARGNLAFDAAIATLCLSQGAQLLTADRDFARFSDLRTLTLAEH
jgi:uncharacterized protein